MLGGTKIEFLSQWYQTDSTIPLMYFLLLIPFVALVRNHDIGVFVSITLLFFTQFFRITRVLWNRSDIIVTGILSWCLLTFRGCGSVRGCWAPRYFCYSAYLFSSVIPEDTDIELLPYFSWWQIVPWLIPSTGGDSTDDIPWLVSLFVRRSEVHDFRGFLGYVLTDGYGWSVWFVSCARYLCLPVSPTTNCITRKFREFIGGNSSSYLGYLSDRCMMWDWGSTSSGPPAHGRFYSGLVVS